MKPLCIYHGGCPDGFTAAWAVAKARGDVELYPAGYGQEPPDVAGRDVYVVDFSYPRETLLKMHEAAQTLLVIDHHKTSQADLEGLEFCTFDMERSGAGLTWDLLLATRRPWVVDYVEDRDLWRHALTDSQIVSDYIMATPHTLEEWEALAATDIEEVKTGGRAIRRKIDAYCQAMESGVQRKFFCGQDGVPVVNAPHVMISDLLHHLCELQERERCMAIGWWRRGDGQYQYSLRSIGDLDVAEIAKEFGGGGHKNAAGFERDSMLL